MESFEDIIRKANEATLIIENIICEELETKATECVAEAKANEAVKTGALRRSITHDNVTKKADLWSVKIGSSLPYC